MGEHLGEPLPRVLVMMATYNGQEFLQQQLESILAQTGVDVTIQVCDDQSLDTTYTLLLDYAAKDTRVHVSRNEKNLGVRYNFLSMVYHSDESYDFYAFSDQDDYWMPDKLRIACKTLSKYPKDKPYLYFSNFYNCDENLENPQEEISIFEECDKRPGTVLVRNWAHGCTMVFNKPMRNLLCVYQPQELLRLHDTWVHMVAKYCATVVPDYEHKTLLRRIHGSNTEGSMLKNYSSLGNAFRAILKAFEPSNRCWTKAAQELNKGYRHLVRPDMLPYLDQFLHYSDSLGNRIRIARSEAFRMPTAAMCALSIFSALFKRW